MIPAPSLAPDAALALPAFPPAVPASGVYVHIPFCLLRCAYCDFNAYAGLGFLKGPYVDALVREISERPAPPGRISTVFFGGGTPTELSAPALARVLSAVRARFDVADDAEITLEANPETATLPVLAALREAGFNRVSIGIQSTDPAVLASLGRAHTAERGLEAIAGALAAGFDNVNADLIFGTPGEGAGSWRRSLAHVAGSGVSHVSAYGLTVEEGTPLQRAVAAGAPAPDEDDQADKYAVASEELGAAGFVQYEISNWARPGMWSRHNCIYWDGGNYHGFGAGAHSFEGSGARATRSWNVDSPAQYARRSPDALAGSEEVEGARRLAEAAMLGLRLTGGMDVAAFTARYGAGPWEVWADPLARLSAEGLVEAREGRLALTPRGRLFASRVAREVMAAAND